MAAKAKKRKYGDDEDEDDDETMKTSIPLCRNLSGKAVSRPPRRRLLEASRSVPNVRSGSP